jgi:hypothetical protein
MKREIKVTEKFIKEALKQGFIYEKKQKGEWIIVETLPVHWFHGLYTYRRVRLSDGTLVEQPMDLDESEFGKTLLLSL